MNKNSTEEFPVFYLKWLVKMTCTFESAL